MAPREASARGLPNTSCRVVFLVFDGVTLLDVTGPGEVFHQANLLGASYEIVLASPGGTDVMSNLGVRVGVDGAIEAESADLLVVPGADVFPRERIPQCLADVTLTAAAGAERVASICTGAFILAAAGLLSGKRATTHWKVTDVLAARCPDARVDKDAIFVRDGTTYTSAGITAGIDLALALVEEYHGPELAREVARKMVVYMQRSGGQSQFSAPLQGTPARSSVVRQIAAAVTDDPRGDFSLTALSHLLNVSSRHLTRLVHEELATTPARYVESIRFDVARALLDQGHSATQAAALAGFPSYESLRRSFTRRLGISPAAYQRRFRTTRREISA